MEIITNNKKCIGCEACRNSCSQGAITMQMDKMGFYYPAINPSLCIDCKRCQKTCPLNQRKSSFENQIDQSYAVWNKDKDIRRNSSSGGFFAAIAQFVIERDGIVYGAVFNEHNEVVHAEIETIGQLIRVQGSKYVQSKIGFTFQLVKKQLSTGRYVLFSGTPCQVAALKKYLIKDYTNLIAVDFICHGVPSPGIWRNYLSQMEKKEGRKVSSVSFRAKDNGWAKFSTKYTFEDGFIHDVVHYDEVFTKGFLRNMYLRPSCYECEFKRGNSGADITMADLWGHEKFADLPKDDKGISLVIVNTATGLDFFNQLTPKVECVQINYSEAVGNNPAITESAIPHVGKARFEKLYTKGNQDIAALIEKCFKPTLLMRIKRRLGI